MNAIKTLDDAVTVLIQRNAAYGPASDSMAAIAARWSVTLGTPVTPAKVVLCMIDLKLARLAHNPQHRDSVLDVIGYAALLPEIDR